MNKGARHIPDALLECYLVESLDAEARAELEAMLVRSEADRTRLEELRHESVAFLAQHPHSSLVERFDASHQNPGVDARRVPDALLECYLVESLDVEARAEVEAVLAESEADRARLEDLRRESAAFLMQHQPESLVERFKVPQRVLPTGSGTEDNNPSETSRLEAAVDALPPRDELPLIESVALLHVEKKMSWEEVGRWMNLSPARAEQLFKIFKARSGRANPHLGLARTRKKNEK